MRLSHLFIALSLSSTLARAEDIPPCSGMARWGPARYLVTHDLKAGQSGHRFGLISTVKQLAYQSLECDWSQVGEESNDLESVAPLEGAPDNYLACESGYYKGQYGHLYWIEKKAGDAPALVARARYSLPTGLTQEIEGLATLKLSENRWLIVLGGRGGRSEEPGRLYWGVLDRSQARLEWPAEGLRGCPVPLPRRMGPFARTLSDMMLDSQHRLYVSSCASPGKQGPNRSLIFLAGTIQADLKKPFHRAAEYQDVWWIDGCKVEGISPCDRPGYGPAYVSDDDELGGLWRAVPLSPSLAY